ncbi:MAG: lipid A deacylase LpxR family protein [Acetobacteraceae bacterium]|nr:lipid A deacylase LpxR family protein [Acetobacteraceae bacterium]
MLLGAIASGAVSAQEVPKPDPYSTLTVQIENDSTNPHSDRYYTSGLRLGYTSPTGQVPGFLADFGHSLLGDGQQRLAVDLSQLIFTPDDTQASNPPLTDRPYAGILMGTFSLIQDTRDTRTALSLGLGIIGPAALGEEVQNGWHSVIGNTTSKGWGTQIPNQPVVQLTAERTWRLPLARPGGLELDALPELTAAAGTFRIYGQAGAQIRAGQGLDSDFGASRIRPGLTGTDAYAPTRDVAWYVFAGADGQAVAWDETLDGLPFGSSRHVSRVPFVGELQAGFTLIVWGIRLTASQTWQTAEFRTQRPGLFQFTSASLSFKF